MYRKKLVIFISTILVLSTGVFSIVLASDDEREIRSAGANVSIVAENATDIYAAGASVTIEGTAKQDVWAAGAIVNIDTQTGGDLHAAGARVSVKGNIAGAARLAAAELLIDAEIGETLNAAAASIKISEDSKVPADSSLAAALIEFKGTAKDNLKLYADELVFSGQASGSVTIEGRNIQISDTARIEGDLTIRSSEDAIISPNASVVGTLIQTDLTESEFFREREGDSNGLGFYLTLSASVFLLGLILVVFARGFVEQGITVMRTHPGLSILWGFFVFFGTPILVLVAMVIVVGIPIGIAILMLLPFMLILGFTTTTLGLSDWIFNKKSDSKKTSERLLLFAAGVLLLIIVGFVPFFGGLIIFLAMLFGLGAVSMTLGRLLSGTTKEAY